MTTVLHWFQPPGVRWGWNSEWLQSLHKCQAFMSWALGPIWQPPKEKIGHPALILLSTSDFTENVGMFQGSSIVDGLTVQTGTRHDINQKSKFETLYILLSFNLLPWHYYTDHRCRSLNFNQWQVILFLGKSNVTVERTWLFFFCLFPRSGNTAGNGATNVGPSTARCKLLFSIKGADSHHRT